MGKTEPIEIAQELVSSRQPTRIAVLVPVKSVLYSSPSQHVVETACSTLGISADDSHPTLLVVEKWGMMDTLAFDVFHLDYDWSTAHQEANLPVILVAYGRRCTVVKPGSPDLQKEVNGIVAREHDLHGWDARPPYVVDHTGTKVPTYPNPRNLVMAPPKPADQSSDMLH